MLRLNGVCPDPNSVSLSIENAKSAFTLRKTAGRAEQHRIDVLGESVAAIAKGAKFRRPSEEPGRPPGPGVGAHRTDEKHDNQENYGDRGKRSGRVGVAVCADTRESADSSLFSGSPFRKPTTRRPRQGWHAWPDSTCPEQQRVELAGGPPMS